MNLTRTSKGIQHMFTRQTAYFLKILKSIVFNKGPEFLKGYICSLRHRLHTLCSVSILTHEEIYANCFFWKRPEKYGNRRWQKKTTNISKQLVVKS